ncbi:ferric reductase like protein [Solirubrobacter pauli]|uniref:Ferric reductase like protein n=1 Tax=Solirubrobacter pauli TaxID=166793 RepID=A0A660LEX0_9ACTN|nr:ferric reductase-like transmembrane domain-containing protein [Solirubrobacter pauli]RKQ93119.1 ferric reductase like protein [Solirubrobacter pauli]
MGEHVFWITSRAAGISALLAASAAVALGLLMGGRMSTRKDLRVLHEALSLGTLVALAVHALALLGDRYLDPSLADISIPFLIDYRPFWTGLGIVGGWLLALLGVSYYFRTKIGVARWRKLHRWTALAWALGLVHAVGAGTDAGAAWFLVAAGMVVLPAAALLTRRLVPAT